ncbi:hypothetical protein GmHk_09G026253 [Glycine max]|nr:hypothetical protein GmHk_09G026253 [Glycine max]
MEEKRRQWRGCLETVTMTAKWSEGSNPSMVEMVYFMESLAAGDMPFEMAELSRGSMRRRMAAITVKPWSKLRMETASSERQEGMKPPRRCVRGRRTEGGRGGGKGGGLGGRNWKSDLQKT